MGRALVNKAQKGMTMRQIKSKYPSADTTAKGDVRGSEMNSGAPKKVLKKYNDLYNAFDRKYKNGPAKDKKGGVVKKAQLGKELFPGGVKRTSPSDMSPSSKLPMKPTKIKMSPEKMSKDWSNAEREATRPKRIDSSRAISPMKKGGFIKKKMSSKKIMMKKGGKISKTSKK